MDRNNLKITLPKFTLIRDYKGQVDLEKLFNVVFFTFIFSTLFAWMTILVIHVYKHFDGPQPKVIVKTVKVNEFTAAQNAYVQQCENDTKDGGNNYQNGIPNVSSTPWTCTFPN